MLLRYFHVTSRRLIMFMLPALMLTSGALVFARWKSSAPAESNKPSAQRSDTELEAEIVTATPAGFEPSEITRPRAALLLLIRSWPVPNQAHRKPGIAIPMY